MGLRAALQDVLGIAAVQFSENVKVVQYLSALTCKEGPLAAK